MTGRRGFFAQLTAAAAALALEPDEARADLRTDGPWDTSWVPKVEAAKYKVVFNGSEVAEGAVFNFANAFMDNFKDTMSTTDAQTRPVIVLRRLGTVMGLNDAAWDRYGFGEDRKINDGGVPARRNVFWKSNSGDASRIEPLTARGLICLVCNVSIGSISRGLGEKLKKDPAEVAADLKANLVSGAILVPSGIYALIHAQNLGCAFMPGT